MIDLFSIVFSTGLVMLIIFRAIRRDAVGDALPQRRNDFGPLNDISRIRDDRR
jgi:hypothetical protein